MRSEFEKYYKEHHSENVCSVDASLEMRGDDYIDFHAADLWELWQHQQSKVDELQQENKNLQCLIKRHEVGKKINLRIKKNLRNENQKLLERVETYEDLMLGLLAGRLNLEDLEQALKGERL